MAITTKKIHNVDNPAVSKGQRVPVQKTIKKSEKTVAAPASAAPTPGAILYKPGKNDVKQIGHVPLQDVLKMLRYAARHGDFLHVYSAAGALSEHSYTQCLRRELVEFMLGSGFLLWYPMHAMVVLQAPPEHLASYFANVCYEVSHSDFFMMPDLCTRRACDANFNYTKDLNIAVNDAAFNRRVGELYENLENPVELQARASVFAYCLIVGINSCERDSFDLSWLDVALRNLFFLSRFGVHRIFGIFDLMCTQYKFCEPYAELMPKVRALHENLEAGKPSTFYWNRGTRLILVYLTMFFFFRCVYENRDLPAHNIIPAARVPFFTKYEAFIAPKPEEYKFARFANIRANMFRGHILQMYATCPLVPLKSIPPIPMQQHFARSRNMLWSSLYANTCLAAFAHFTVNQLHTHLALKVSALDKTLLFGPVFPAELDAIGKKITTWSDKLAKLKIDKKVVECARAYFSPVDTAATLGGILFIHVPLNTTITVCREEQWSTYFVKMFACLCATLISDIGLRRDMFYNVGDKLFCAAMWMPTVILLETYTVEQQLQFLDIPQPFYNAHKKSILYSLLVSWYCRSDMCHFQETRKENIDGL